MREHLNQYYDEFVDKMATSMRNRMSSSFSWTQTGAIRWLWSVARMVALSKLTYLTIRTIRR